MEYDPLLSPYLIPKVIQGLGFLIVQSDDVSDADVLLNRVNNTR